jgi:hypothetical protein
MPRSRPHAWLALTACLLLATGAHAAPPSDADIERLLTASRAQGMLDAIGPQMEAMQRQQFQQLAGDARLTPEQHADAERIRARSSQIMRESLSWEQMRPLYIDVYRQTFTSEEVKAMAKFYESPTGKAMLDKTPVLMQNLMAAMQTKVMPMLEALKTELDVVAGEGGTPAASPAD